MDTRDATLMFLAESAGYSEIARSAYDQPLRDGDIDYDLLSDLVDEASGKGVLRAMRQKYSPAAFDAIISPVLREVGRRKPIRSSRPGWQPQPGEDPLGG